MQSYFSTIKLESYVVVITSQTTPDPGPSGVRCRRERDVGLFSTSSLSWMPIHGRRSAACRAPFLSVVSVASLPGAAGNQSGLQMPVLMRIQRSPTCC
jgi:hypothetical protein